MSYTIHEESILTDLRDYFADDYATCLEGIFAEQTDGLSLPDFKVREIGEADIFKLNAYPALLLFPEEVIYEPLTTLSEDLQMTIDAIMVLKGAVSENLSRKALRYAAAARQLFDADRTAGAKVDSARVSRIRYNARTPGAESFMVIEVLLAVSKEVSRD